MRFTVPQFIEIEDKIFGPLTWKQFLYVGGGFGMTVAIFLTMPRIIFILVGLPLAGLAGALAFYPINGRPFSVFLESAFNYMLADRRYFWQQNSAPVYTKKQNRADVANTDATAPSEQRVASLSRKLELEALEKEELYKPLSESKNQ